jgi:hypothetical protein
MTLCTYRANENKGKLSLPVAIAVVTGAAIALGIFLTPAATLTPERVDSVEPLQGFGGSACESNTPSPVENDHRF